jgi:hypothetical protein
MIGKTGYRALVAPAILVARSVPVCAAGDRAAGERVLQQGPLLLPQQ